MTVRHNRLRVFIASPGDVPEEREIASLVVSELRRVFEDLLPIPLEAVRWETHAWPDVGVDAQDVINREIGEFDIFVGIMWRRFGTPTKRARSGTDEEFQRAYDYFRKYKRPRVMFYFRKSPFYTTDVRELKQFQKVIKFRRELEKLGVLFWEYDTPIDFERSVREHLIRQILPRFTLHSSKPKKAPVTGKRPPVGTRPAKAVATATRAYRPTVFLAYSHADVAAVMKIYEDLRLAGFNPWIDRENLLPGQMWHTEVDSIIKKADAVVLCLSKASVLKQGFFHKEMRSAHAQARTHEDDTASLIPIRLERTPLPADISTLPYLDYFLPNGPERLAEVLWSVTKRSRKRAEPSRPA